MKDGKIITDRQNGSQRKAERLPVAQLESAA
jgi:hypothetical protein